MNFGIDKVKHLAVGLIIASVVTFVMYHGLYALDLYDPTYGKVIVACTQFLAVSMAGAYKENRDDVFDWWDLIFTIIPGIFFFVIILIYF